MSSCFEDPFFDLPSEARIYQLGCGPSASPQRVTLWKPLEIHELQHVDRIFPFLSIGIDSSAARMNVEQSIEDLSLDRFVESVLRRLSSASPELGFFLRDNLEIAASLEQVLDCLDNFLNTNNVSYSLGGDVWQDLEAPFYKVLEIVVKVNVVEYEGILRLWRTANEKIYENLKPSARKMIIVLFERS
jgi:hypothetical protein